MNEYEMYLGLDPDTAMECFDFDIYGKKAEDLGRKTPEIFFNDGKVTAKHLIRYTDTPCFAVNRYSISSDTLTLSNAPAVYIVTKGKGIIEKEGFCHEIQKGDYFFLPHCCRNLCSARPEASFELIESLPPKI